MKLVAHISDLHFGCHDPQIEAALLDELDGRTVPGPDLVVISGDLTQRARRSQFAAARQFLRRLEVPYLVVPGNHDIPLFDLLNRFFRARERYYRYITDDLAPFYADEELAVVGIDTVQRSAVKDGKVRLEQVLAACKRLRDYPQHWKILVAHHPFVVPSDIPGADDDLVEGHAAAMPLLEEVGVDLIMTGHLHVPSSDDVAGRNDAHTIVAVHAGSCISTRLRGHPNSYNQLVFEDDRCLITARVWDGAQFVEGDGKSYHRTKPVGPERLIKESGFTSSSSYPGT